MNLLNILQPSGFCKVHATLLSVLNRLSDSNVFLVVPSVRKHVVFGKLILGHEVLRSIENVDVDGDRPVVPVKIVSCGELNENVTILHENGTIIWKGVCFCLMFFFLDW